LRTDALEFKSFDHAIAITGRTECLGEINRGSIGATLFNREIDDLYLDVART
jgi:hypothetical protein